MSEHERMRALVAQLANAASDLSEEWMQCSDGASDTLTRNYPAGVPCLYELAAALHDWQTKLEEVAA